MPDLNDPFFDIALHKKKVGHFDIVLDRNWDCVPLTRSYLENYLDIHMFKKEDISRIEMAASELLENCVKYSNREGIRMILKINREEKAVEISVLNYTGPGEAEIVRSRIEEMNQKEPLQYYLYRIRMAREYKQKYNSGGIGLSRIYYEGQAHVSTQYNPDKELLAINVIIKYT